MKCEECIELINEYADGELSPDKIAEVEEHISKCEKCRTYLDEICFIKTAVADIGEEVPQELHGRIMDAVKEEKKKKTAKITFLRSKAFGWAIAACFLFVIAGSFIPELIGVNIEKGAAEMFDKSKRDGAAYSDMAMDAPEECLDLPATAPEEPSCPNLPQDPFAPSVPGEVESPEESDNHPVKLVFSTNGKLPSYLNEYDAKYDGNEVFIFFEYADKAIDFANILKLDGFISVENIELTESAKSILSGPDNVIIIVLK